MMPQVNNAIHYFVVHHEFKTEHSSKTDVHSHLDNHHCEQHIYIQSAVLLPTLLSFNFKILTAYSKENTVFSIQFISRFFFSGYTRGPPAYSII